MKNKDEVKSINKLRDDVRNFKCIRLDRFIDALSNVYETEYILNIYETLSKLKITDGVRIIGTAGSGKTTLANKLMNLFPHLYFNGSFKGDNHTYDGIAILVSRSNWKQT